MSSFNRAASLDGEVQRKVVDSMIADLSTKQN